jgi:hypothetical protein
MEGQQSQTNPPGVPPPTPLQYIEIDVPDTVDALTTTAFNNIQYLKNSLDQLANNLPNIVRNAVQTAVAEAMAPHQQQQQQQSLQQQQQQQPPQPTHTHTHTAKAPKYLKAELCKKLRLKPSGDHDTIPPGQWLPEIIRCREDVSATQTLNAYVNDTTFISRVIPQVLCAEAIPWHNELLSRYTLEGHLTLTFDKYCDEFKKRFLGPAVYEQAKSRFENCKQDKFPIMSHLNEMRKRYEAVKTLPDSAITDLDARDTLVRSLNKSHQDTARQYIAIVQDISNITVSFEQVIAHLEKTHSQEDRGRIAGGQPSAHGARPAARSSPSQSSSYNGPQPMDIDNMQTEKRPETRRTLASFIASLNPQQKEWFEQKKCLSCGSPDHKRKDCPNRASRSSGNH